MAVPLHKNMRLAIRLVTDVIRIHLDAINPLVVGLGEEYPETYTMFKGWALSLGFEDLNEFIQEELCSKIHWGPVICKIGKTFRLFRLAQPLQQMWTDRSILKTQIEKNANFRALLLQSMGANEDEDLIDKVKPEYFVDRRPVAVVQPMKR